MQGCTVTSLFPGTQVSQGNSCKMGPRFQGTIRTLESQNCHLVESKMWPFSLVLSRVSPSNPIHICHPDDCNRTPDWPPTSTPVLPTAPEVSLQNYRSDDVCHLFQIVQWLHLIHGKANVIMSPLTSAPHTPPHLPSALSLFALLFIKSA